VDADRALTVGVERRHPVNPDDESPPIPGLNRRIDDLVLLPDPPARFNETELNRMLVFLSKAGVSDIKLQSGGPVMVKIAGLVRPATKRQLSPQEVADMLSIIYGANGPTIIKDGRDIDKGYELQPGRTERYRFRVNAVGGLSRGQQGIEITIRTVKIDPPTMEEVMVEPGIAENAFPPDGIVVVAGPTGSGKSTLIASFIRRMLEEENGNRFMVTFESPIEYVYDSVRRPSSVIWQTEIGPSSDLATFADGIRNAMRRAPDVIFTGESRDIETVDASIAAAQSGHSVYTTVHANSVVDTFRRMVNLFQPDARSGVMNNLVSSVRMVIWQRLFVRADQPGQRIAVREFLPFTLEVREELLSMGADNQDKMLAHMRKLVKTRGCSAGDCAAQFYREGYLREQDVLDISAGEV
jgi:defect-in-organelle-trafficking protein DotB